MKTYEFHTEAGKISELTLTTPNDVRLQQIANDMAKIQGTTVTVVRQTSGEIVYTSLTQPQGGNRIKPYANLIMYSDVRPFEVVKVISEKTIEIRPMDYEKDSNWGPEFVPGGFSAVCINQEDQKWIYRSAPERPVVRCRLHNDGSWYSKYGLHILQDEPRRKYDYNF